MESGTRLTRHEAATKAARARWDRQGPRRIIHIGDLSPEKRRLVLAFVEMAKAQSVSETPDRAQEARRALDETPEAA